MAALLEWSSSFLHQGQHHMNVVETTSSREWGQQNKFLG